MYRCVIMLGLVASPALGQATTDCTRDYFGNVHCVTNPSSTVSPQAPADYGALLNSGRAAVPDYDQTQQQELQLRVQQALLEAQEQSRKAGQMIAKGDCSGAEQYALKKGNIELARQVRDYCAK